MTAPNRSTLWGRAVVAELAAGGLSAACVAPGSRSTPLTMAVESHPDVTSYSHLDERSAAFFALGRSKRLGEPTALVCTSGTAAANFHPAVVEAHHSRVPLVVLTADRPAELRDSGANQTIDQAALYGDAVRWARTLPEPAAEPRRLRSLRVAVARALAASRAPNSGPVHCNVPLPKPLEPTPVDGDVPADFDDEAPLAASGRDGPFVATTRGRPAVDDGDVAALARRLAAAARGLIVAGPAVGSSLDRTALADLAGATGVPVLADPLSGHRFGPHVERLPVCGGYDGYLDAVDWPDPDLVLRFGASPTSKVCRHYLRDADADQVIVDAAGEWPEAEFTASDLVVADPTRLARRLTDELADAAGTADGSPVPHVGAVASWRDRFEAAEESYWSVVAEAASERYFEGGLVHAVAAACPARATLVVSNSMPVRDLDRFGRPRTAPLAALGNRGASGIDGVTSTALGAGVATADPMVLVTGDLAYYHDMNGLLALDRCDVDATVVVLNNDGGGIFHQLPVAEFDPPFTDQFVTPHGLDFEPTGDLYDLSFVRATDRDEFRTAYREGIDADGTTVVEARIDGQESHRFRDALEKRVADRVG
jgi:2-succinyl-5-enolpyruvyl-6-hydroxy-3-cyclohexene-1-carboxylate synthase